MSVQHSVRSILFAATGFFLGVAGLALAQGVGASARMLSLLSPGLETVTLDGSNNYTAVAGDCGKTKLLPTGITPTVTLPNLNQPCTIVFNTLVAKSYLFNAASGGSKQNSQAFYNSRGTNAGDVISVWIVTPSASAAKWNIAGDLTS